MDRVCGLKVQQPLGVCTPSRLATVCLRSWQRPFSSARAGWAKPVHLHMPRLSPTCTSQRLPQANSESSAAPALLKVASGVAAWMLTSHWTSVALAASPDIAPSPQAQPSQVAGNAQPDRSSFGDLAASALQRAPDLKWSDKDYQLPPGNEWRYSEFLDVVERGRIERVLFKKEGDMLQAIVDDGRRVLVTLPFDPTLVDKLVSNQVDIQVTERAGNNGLLGLLASFGLPLILLAGTFFLFSRGSRGGGGGPFGAGGGMNPFEFGKNTSKFQEVPNTGVTFADVAGVDQAKLELQEIVDFLKNPDKYTSLGAKIPRGALLVGPPGTGKTLLARAIAGEAGVPFFSGAASEFVEMFVGVGASRVRDLFEKAKSKAPCIIFIDEIDAVGRQRGAGMGGGNDEREQTINQLLSEMDGFQGNTGVIVLAATNRPDVLDTALTRPGRFDRQITVERPDVQGRIAILKVHTRNKKLASDVDLDKVSRRTPGFTGADLQNLMNEAAILTARRSKEEVTAEDIDDALEKLIVGPEKKGSLINERKRRLVAYHEAGHAIIGALLPEYDPVQKISIVPRGATGGATFFAPNEDQLESGLYSRSYLENRMAVALGGRVAEELILGPDDVTTGAANDFQQVARLAKTMVAQCGFSKELGQVAWQQSGGPSFLGQEVGQAPECSGETQNEIDERVKELVDRAYRRAKELLYKNMGLMHKVAAQLMKDEQMDGDDFQRLVWESQAEAYLARDAPELPTTYGDNGAPVVNYA